MSEKISINSSSIQGNIIGGDAHNISSMVNASSAENHSLTEIATELNELIEKCIDVEGRKLTEKEEIAVAGKVVSQIPGRPKLMGRLKCASQEALATGIEKSIEKIHSSIAISVLISGVKGFIQAG
ncbi:MAG: hypothetical protein ACFCA4_02790 [Cyanophyceae cyanobacterium]